MSTILTYHREGDYLIPDLVPPEEPQIGPWGRRRKRYLQQYRDPIYTGLLLSGKLKDHLEEIDRSASEMVDRLVEEMARREGITEALKAEDQMEWLRRMNSIRNRAKDTLLSEFVYFICTE